MSPEIRISRNASCPCGSGKKYKRCCGAIAQFSESNPGSEVDEKGRVMHTNASRISQRPFAPELASNLGPILPSSAERMYADAAALSSSGRIADAKEKYEEILRTWPNEVRAMSRLGYCLVNLGQRDIGLAEAKRAIEFDPTDVTSIMELSLLFYNLGEVEDSLKWARQAVKLGPHGANAYTIIANCYERTHQISESPPVL